jgi:hypothetical protein
MSNYADLNYSQAHEFVESNASRGFYWNGWDIVKWTANPNGCTQKNGMFRNGTWGFAMTIPCSDSGTWKVLTKYV